MEKYNFSKEYIFILILLLIIGLLIGFGIGSYTTIKAVAAVAGGFIDEEIISKALYQYNNNIRNCYPSVFENASLYMGEGN